MKQHPFLGAVFSENDLKGDANAREFPDENYETAKKPIRAHH